MTRRVKNGVKKTGIVVAILGAITSCVNAYVKLAEQKSKREQFEVFYSNEQDKLRCWQMHEDSIHHSNINCN